MKKSNSCLVFLVVFSILLIISGCESADKSKKIIQTDSAPEAIGPYSQAVQVGDIIYLAGQIAINPDSNKIVNGGIEEQTYQVLDNIKAVLNSAEFEMGDITKCQIFLTDMDNYPKINRIYATYFEKDFPARAVVEVSRLPKDVLIEIMVTAHKSN